jgi:hypothetical protein
MKPVHAVGRLAAAIFGVLAIAGLPTTGSAAGETISDPHGGTVSQAELQKVLPGKPYSPYAGRNFPARPLFGDTHLHTSYSLDAGVFGARLGPREAYQFARGEEVTASSGQRAKLSRPLDFLVVADHSDNMGFFPQLISGKPEMLADPTGRRWYEMMQAGEGAKAAFEIIAGFSDGSFPKALEVNPGTPAFRAAWKETIEAAEEYNDPGRFTAFIGYEWTSQGSFNIHRNVIFRDNGDKASRVEPFTVAPPAGSPNERDLWKWMQAFEDKTGGDVLAIAHNGNVSNARMFPLVEYFTGKPMDRSYAEARAKWEHLYETTQMKGDGESHPFLSPNDEFAGYETWDKGNLDVSAAKTQDMLQYEYTREALKNGLKMEQKLGVNPFKIGLIGSTDSHTGLTTAEEDNFFGKVTPMEPNAHRLSKAFLNNAKTGLTIMEWEVAASGYAAVWATENTREAIFDAMERREAYATTGPRMVVRFFGGWEFTAADALSRSPAVAGYTKGVPMGGDLRAAPAGKSPTFLVAALKDPIGANLDRIQIIKGWLDAKGNTHEQVYDVVWGDADKRKAGENGRIPPVGNTVDVAHATWTNTIGDPELIAVWTDPDFDAKQRAFYYVRVMEIPTPRWTAYDAMKFGVEPLPGTPMTTAERAYTSPIWYTP